MSPSVCQKCARPQRPHSTPAGNPCPAGPVHLAGPLSCRQLRTAAAPSSCWCSEPGHARPTAPGSAQPGGKPRPCRGPGPAGKAALHPLRAGSGSEGWTSPSPRSLCPWLPMKAGPLHLSHRVSDPLSLSLGASPGRSELHFTCRIGQRCPGLAREHGLALALRGRIC